MSVERHYYDRDNSVLAIEVFIINDKMEGEYKSYYDSNSSLEKSPKLFCNYVNGLKEGQEIEYYDNGQINCIRHYKKGKLDGELKEYYYDGTLEMIENYDNDCREGEARYYNKNGELDEIRKKIDINLELDILISLS